MEHPEIALRVIVSSIAKLQESKQSCTEGGEQGANGLQAENLWSAIQV